MKQKKQEIFNQMLPGKKDVVLFNLTFNGQMIVSRQPYPVCVAKKNQMLPSCKGLSHLFQIKRSEA